MIEHTNYQFIGSCELVQDLSIIVGNISQLSPRQHRFNHPDLRQRIDAILPYVSLTSETARRENLVAPILMNVVVYCHCQFRIEYPLSLNNWLKGNLDYLLRAENSLLVIEAKNDDLTRGFTQLAVELIALAVVEEQDVFYGAVTIGNACNFGKLEVMSIEEHTAFSL